MIYGQKCNLLLSIHYNYITVTGYQLVLHNLYESVPAAPKDVQLC